MREYRFTSDTEIEVPSGSVQEVHLEDLSFILNIETDGEEVTSCEVDLTNLIQAMTIFSSMESFEYDWRSYGEIEKRTIREE